MQKFFRHYQKVIDLFVIMVIMNKCYVVLDMYERLKNGEMINLNNSCKEYGISEPTFRRYLSVLRNFCCKKLRREIAYIPKCKGYELRKSNKNG